MLNYRPNTRECVSGGLQQCRLYVNKTPFIVTNSKRQIANG